MKEHCGVSGALLTSVEDVDVVESIALAHQALDHRGQDGAGIAVWDGEQVHVSKGEGRTKNVLDLQGEHVPTLRGIGTLAIGHNRYGTDKNAVGEAAVQPYAIGSFAQGHNGHLTNLETFAKVFDVDVSQAQSDSHGLTVVVAEVAEREHDGDILQAYRDVLPHVEGAFSIVSSVEDKLVAIRDRHGVRPLVLGRLPGGSPMFASEVTALKKAGASFESEVKPGEMVVIDAEGNERRELWITPEPGPCLFEYVYFSKGTNFIEGTYVNDVRTEMGRRLARRDAVEADVVIDVPASGEQFALGYADETGIPYGFAFIKNYEKGRVFIGATESERQKTAREKFKIIPEAVAGKRVIMVDDSIVRGTSIKVPVQMLRDAGATEVHVRIPSDQYRDICQYGVDTGDLTELMAARLNGDVEQMRLEIGADSLAFLPLTEMTDALGTTEVCSGCMGGNYPGQKEFVIEADQLFGRVRELAAR